MMTMLIKIAWYLSTIVGAIWFIPFNLSMFSVWELLKIWPFVLTFFEVIALILLGFNVPEWVASYLNTHSIFKAVNRENKK